MLKERLACLREAGQVLYDVGFPLMPETYVRIQYSGILD